MLQTLPIDSAQLAFIGLSVEAKTEFGTTQQKVSREGVPLWTLAAVLTNSAEVVKVTVPGPAAPTVIAGAPVRFANLRAGAYAAGKDGRFYFTADAAESATR